MTSPVQLAGKPKKLFPEETLTWEEGGFVVRLGDSFILFSSQGNWRDGSYHVLAARAEKLTSGNLRTRASKKTLEQLAMGWPARPAMDVGTPFREWLSRAMGDKRLLSKVLSKMLLEVAEKANDLLVGNTNNPSGVRFHLKRYSGRLNESLRKYPPAPKRFTYSGLVVDNPAGLPDTIVRQFLDGIDYLVALFKRRGVDNLFYQSVKQIMLNKSYPSSTLVSVAAGLYHPDKKAIELAAPTVEKFTGRLLNDWVHEIFLHELGHHLHMSILPKDAKAEWDRGWAGVEEAKKNQEEVIKDKFTVSPQERKRFWEFLLNVKGNLKAIRLKGVDRAKFHAWLRNPYAGGSWGPLVTPKQLRWTKEADFLVALLRDPRAFVLDRVLGSDKWDADRMQKSIDQRLRHYSLNLGVESDSNYPILDQEAIDEYRREDKSVAQALEALEVPSGYAQTNEMEDFAESFVVFMTAPEKLSDTAKYRMQRTLSLAGLYGKPIMRLASIEEWERLLAAAGPSYVYRIQPKGKPLKGWRSKDWNGNLINGTFVFESLRDLKETVPLWRESELEGTEVLEIKYDGPRTQHPLEEGTLIDVDQAKVVRRIPLERALSMRSAAGMPRYQYHATSWDRVPSIIQKGIQLPRGQKDVSTFMHDTPSVSTADKPEDAQVYHPQGALLKLSVKPGSKYLKRSPRAMRRGETLLDAVNRWSKEVLAKGADGFWMDGWQSTVGNQTFNPKALVLEEVMNSEQAPVGVDLGRFQKHADLAPPLGYPGGVCHVVRRIDDEVRNPRVKDNLTYLVEEGGKLTNPEAAKVYDLDKEKGPGGPIKRVEIGPHAQYRMDLRGVTVPEVRLALKSFTKQLNDWKSRKDWQFQSHMELFRRGEPIKWTDPQVKLTVVFAASGRDQVKLVTTYWEGVKDPVSMGSGQCQVRFAASHARSIALMKFLSGVSRRLNVGKHVYVVGGAIRNFVIDQPIKDVDVVIDSKALGGKDSEWFAKEVVKAIPVAANLTTNQYGVAIITVKGDWELEGENLAGEVIEIANARKESYGGAGGKGYKPHMVEPATIEEDIYRREFRFNTLLWRLHDLAQGPDKAEIVDITGCGLRDLEKGEMRCPSDPDKTFSDDPTRLLRAVKFLVKYGLNIPSDTAKAIQRNAPKLKRAPHNAISELLIGTILKDPSLAKKALGEMKRLGLLDVVAEMIRENRAFRATMQNWASNQKVLLLFDMMDIGLPLTARIDFLSSDQQRRLREVSIGMPEGDPERLVDILKQPGRVLDMKGLIKEFGLKGRDIAKITEAAREVLLAAPELRDKPRQLGDEVRAALKTTKLAAWVSPSGEVHDVRGIGHAKWAADWLRHEGISLKDVPLDRISKIVDPAKPDLEHWAESYLLNQGWTRSEVASSSSPLLPLAEWESWRKNAGSITLDLGAWEEDVWDQIRDSAYDAMWRYEQDVKKTHDLKNLVERARWFLGMTTRVVNDMATLADSVTPVFRAVAKLTWEEFQKGWWGREEVTRKEFSDRQRSLLTDLRSYQRAMGEAPSLKAYDPIAEKLIRKGKKQAEWVKGQVQDAAKRVRDWRVSTVIIKLNYDKTSWTFLESPPGSYYVQLGSHRGAPGFTLFTKGNTIHDIDDVLDAGDTYFFGDDPSLVANYFDLIKELKNPGSSQRAGKNRTLYTARPTKDRALYEKGKVPSNIYLTTDYNRAEGISHDLGSNEVRDIWRVVINEQYLVPTLLQGGRPLDYQTVGRGWIPVKSIRLVSEGEAGRTAALASIEEWGEALRHTAAALPRKGPKYKFFVFGTDRGRWWLEPRVSWDSREWKEKDWYATPSFSRKNDWRNLSVEGATEQHAGFRKALREMVAQYPELKDWIVEFDGPYRTVAELLGLSTSKTDWSELLFYHGTSMSAWESIQVSGLKPRGETNVEPVYGTGVGAEAGRVDAVYLTTQLGTAKFAAGEAARKTRSPAVVLAIVNVDPRFVRADEDSKSTDPEVSLAKLGSIAYIKAIDPMDIELMLVKDQDRWVSPEERGRVAKATGEKRKYLDAIKRGQSAIEKAIRSDSVEEAIAAYERLAKELRPLGGLLEGVRVQRRDEQRKLKTVTKKVKLIQRYTTPGHMQEFFQGAGIEPNTYGVQLSMEDLVDTAKGILRYYDRIEGYRSLEQSFQHGPFTMLNIYGYRPDEYEGALVVLDKAAEAVRAAGFSSVLYGEVRIVGGDSNRGFAGKFRGETDTVLLNADASNRFSSVYTLVHELGHRHWFKVLNRSQREAYDEAYAGTSTVLTVAQRETMWEAWKKSGYNARKMKRLLPPALFDLWRVYYKELKGSVATVPDPRLDISEDLVKKLVVKPGIRFWTLEEFGLPSSVTDYGRTSVIEDYAEVFAHFVLGKTLTEDAKSRFMQATGRKASQLVSDQEWKRFAKTFKIEIGDPVLTGKFMNSPGIVSGFGKDPKGNPTIIVEKGAEGGGPKKEMKLFKVRYDTSRKKKAAGSQRQRLIEDARAAGFEVKQDSDGTVSIVKIHRGTGRPIRGLVIYPNGTAFDATVDLSVARGFRSYKAMRSVLGLPRVASLDRLAGPAKPGSKGQKHFRHGEFEVWYRPTHAQHLDIVKKGLSRASGLFAQAGWKLPSGIPILLASRPWGSQRSFFTSAHGGFIQLVPDAVVGPADFSTFVHELAHYYQFKKIGANSSEIQSRFDAASSGEGEAVSGGNSIERAQDLLDELDREQAKLAKGLRKGKELTVMVRPYSGPPAARKVRIRDKKGSGVNTKFVLEFLDLTPEEERKGVKGTTYRLNALLSNIQDPTLQAAWTDLRKRKEEALGAYNDAVEGRTETSRYEDPRTKWFPTEYAKKNSHEFFAELVTARLLSPQSMDPEVSGWLDSVMKGTSWKRLASPEEWSKLGKYKSKKEVPKADGKGTTTVYEYGPRQVADRNKEKAKKVEKLRGSISKLRAQVKKDLKAEDEGKRLSALAVGLMDETYERVGNDESASKGHFGVTGWQVKHVTFSGGKATVKYVGKSGVSHKKVVEDKALVAALKEVTKNRKPEDSLTGTIGSKEVNEYLKPFGVTAKDVRGYHANAEMQNRLKAIRSEGGKLPEDKKEREKKLKDEFERALKESSKAVGHESSTLKSQYLVPGLEESFLKDGTVEDKLDKTAAKPAPVTKPYLTTLIKAVTSIPGGWGSSSPAARLLERELRNLKNLEDGFGREPLTPDELLSYLESEGVDADEMEALRTIKPPRPTRKRIVSLTDAMLQFERVTGKSVVLGVNPGDDQYSKEMLSWAKAIKGLPPIAKRLWESEVKKVRFHTGRGTEDASWGPQPGWIHLVVTGKSTYSIPSLRLNVIHELGHALEEKTDAHREFFKTYGIPPYVSDYAKVNGSEDFAESFAVFVLHPRNLKKVSPEKYEDMRVRVGARRGSVREAIRTLRQRQASVRIAGLANELEQRVEKLIHDYEAALAAGKTSYQDLKGIGGPFADWFTSTFRVEVSTTPRGGKPVKEAAKLFLWSAKNRVSQDPTARGVGTLKEEWERFKPHVPVLVAKFSDEGGTAVVKDIKTSHATYRNLRGLSTPTFKKYVKSLDQLFGTLRGWRKKALTGNLTVALAGPESFRGTAGGFYRESEDTLYVRATPKVMKRTPGLYGSPDYILIHELGHRYEAKVQVSGMYGSSWYTTRYSMTDSMAGNEAFAELFALGHFGITKVRNYEFADVIERFEKVMAGSGRVATKSDAEEEEEEVERLNRPAPKKKPPRYDLRRETVKERDPDLVPEGEKDPDLSLNYKRVASQSSLDEWMSALNQLSSPGEGEVHQAAEDTEEPMKPGDVRESDYGFTGMNPKGGTYTFPKTNPNTKQPDKNAKKKAEAFAQGKTQKEIKELFPEEGEGEKDKKTKGQDEEAVNNPEEPEKPKESIDDLLNNLADLIDDDESRALVDEILEMEKSFQAREEARKRKERGESPKPAEEAGESESFDDLIRSLGDLIGEDGPELAEEIIQMEKDYKQKSERYRTTPEKSGPASKEEPKPEPKPEQGQDLSSEPKSEPKLLLQRVQDLMSKAVDRKAQPILNKLKGFPPEVLKNLEETLDSLSPQDQLDMLDAFKERLKEAKLSARQNGYSKKDLNAADKALKEVMGKPKDKPDSPKDWGTKLAEAVFAKKFVANPLWAGGVHPVKGTDDKKELQGRAEAAYDQYVKMSKGLREEVASQAAALLEGMPERDPKRKELERVIDGLALAAAVHGEAVGEGLRPEPSQDYKLVAKDMHNRGTAHKLAHAGALYSPDGRKVVREALDDMFWGEGGPDNLVKFYSDKGEGWSDTAKWVKDIEEKASQGDPAARKRLGDVKWAKDVLTRWGVTGMTTGDALAGVGAGERAEAKKKIRGMVWTDKDFAKAREAFAKCIEKASSPKERSDCSDKGELAQLSAFRKAAEEVFGGPLPQNHPIVAQVNRVLETGDLSELGISYVRQGEKPGERDKGPDGRLDLEAHKPGEVWKEGDSWSAKSPDGQTKVWTSAEEDAEGKARAWSRGESEGEPKPKKTASGRHRLTELGQTLVNWKVSGWLG